MDKLIDKIKKSTGYSSDILYKEIGLLNKKIFIIYSEVITDSDAINDFILKKISYINEQNIVIGDYYEYLFNNLPDHNLVKIKDNKELMSKLFNGYVIIIIDKDNILAAENRASLSRGVSTPSTEPSVKGPKDGFCEHFNTNLGLIRKRIKTNKLWVKNYEIGTRSKTKVGLVYIKGIVRDSLVKSIDNKLKEILIDGIIDSGYIKNYIEESNSFFPTIMSTERCDNVSMALLEGKVVIIVDNSCYALILPTFFIDYFHNPDDYYQKSPNISFIRIIRLLGFLVSILLPAYYIAVTTINHDAIPINMLISFTTQRLKVPFPALIEALIMSVAFEILRESDTRMSSNIGTAVSILGGLVLGDAAVSAGVVSPIMIIVIALSAISGLMFSSIELTSAIRLWRFILMFLGAFLGIYGIFIGIIFLIVSLAKINIFNIPYLAPFSPFNKNEQTDAFIKTSKKGLKRRNKLLSSNYIRGQIK